MSTVHITTSQNITLEYDLASLGERIVGRLLDGLVIAAYVAVILIIFYASNMFDSSIFQLVLFLLMLPIAFYDLVSEIMLNGQSVGKRVMKIKVISLDGGQPTLGQYMLRWLFRLVDFTLSSSLCALICVAVNERRQRLGDIVAGTILIKTVPRTNLQQTMYAPVTENNYQANFPEVAMLADKDIQLIKEVVLNVRKTGNIVLAYQAGEKIKDTLNIQSSLEPLYFLEVLIADYNYLTAKA